MLLPLLILSCLASVTLPASPSHAAGTGHITGTVTGPGGVPKAGIRVEAQIDYGFQFWDQTGLAVYTDASGHYDLTGLAADTYRVKFTDESGGLAFAWWDGAAQIIDGDDIVLADGQTRAGIDEQLVAASHITGTVTAISGGAPLANVEVIAYRDNINGFDLGGSAVTAANGTFDISGLSAGPYWVLFQDNAGLYAREYWNDKVELLQADQINVSASATVGNINAALELGGRIQGTVTGPNGLQFPDDEMSIFAYRRDTTSGNWTYVTTGEPNPATGAYDIGRLPSGTYRLAFSPTSSDYTREFWNDKPTLATADDIIVNAGATLTGKDAQISAAAQPIANLTAPTVSGTPKVGTQLTTTPGTWNPADVTVTFQWFYGNGSAIPGASGSTYTPVAADLGRTILVLATASKTGYTSKSVESDSTAAVTQGTISNLTPPTISGTPQVGAQLSASPGTWSPAGVTTTISWLADGTDIPGATGTTYTPTTTDIGKTISVQVYASKDGYTDTTGTSAATAVVTAATTHPPPPAPGVVTNTAAPTVNGKAQVGAKLRVSPGSWSPAGVALSYQWLANGKIIKNATGASLKLKAAQQGRKISVRVTATAAGYTAGVMTSKATKKVKAKPQKAQRADAAADPVARLAALLS